MESTYSDVSAMITRMLYSHHPCVERLLSAVRLVAFGCNCVQRRSSTQVCLASNVDLKCSNDSHKHLIAMRKLRSPTSSSNRDMLAAKRSRGLTLTRHERLPCRQSGHTRRQELKDRPGLDAACFERRFNSPHLRRLRKADTCQHLPNLT